MPDQSPPPPDEIALRREELELRRFEAKLGLRKVIFGTLIVGLAGILVPAAVEGWSLVFKKWQNEAQLDFERQSRQENFLKGHFSTAINEDLELRLRFAQYFAQTIDGYDGVAEQTERDGKNWTKYYLTLKKQRDELRTKIKSYEEKIRNIYKEKEVSPDKRIELELLEIELGWFYNEIEYVPPERGEKPSASVLAGQSNIPGRVDIPDSANTGLTSARRGTLIAAFGLPRETFDATCRPATREPLQSLIQTADVGPFKVAGLPPATDSLRRIFSRIRKDLPVVYDTLGTYGMFCARSVRNASVPSNHAWGTAIDIKIGDGKAQLGSGLNDGKTLPELAQIAPYFNEEGWFWGVGFTLFEDELHFEVAEETLREWLSQGKFGPEVQDKPAPVAPLAIGDIGTEVRALQDKLAQKGFDAPLSGRFGPGTQAAVVAYQASHGMTQDGIAGIEVLRALEQE